MRDIRNNVNRTIADSSIVKLECERLLKSVMNDDFNKNQLLPEIMEFIAPHFPESNSHEEEEEEHRENQILVEKYTDSYDHDNYAEKYDNAENNLEQNLSQ